MKWLVVIFDIIVFAVATFFIVLVLPIPDSIKNYLFIEMLVAIFLGLIPAIIASNKGKENSSVPLLSSIPLLGEAFKHTEDTISTTELVFVITPHIMGTKGTDKATLKDLGFSQKIYE